MSSMLRPLLAKRGHDGKGETGFASRGRTLRRAARGFRFDVCTAKDVATAKTLAAVKMAR
ncbi:MAG: hypothetical protein MUE80_01955 [Acidobacteria bacterium]|nr:hypothetical protein [Acidobacteriota bacterium]